MTDIVVVDAYPSKSASRRGVMVQDESGMKFELEACEQRSATSWMEALNMMLGKHKGNRLGRLFGGGGGGTGSGAMSEQNALEEQYLNLTAYSNNLIRTGAIPSTDSKAKKRMTGGSGIYYCVSKKNDEGDDEMDEETLESIAKRRAVIKDSWDFYRMICSLLRDRRKYDEAFRRLQMDPVYPYLNSMTGLNDPGDDAGSSMEVMQPDVEEYKTMTRSAVCKDLIKKAEKALPSLVEICKAMAGSLGMEEVGVGKFNESLCVCTYIYIYIVEWHV